MWNGCIKFKLISQFWCFLSTWKTENRSGLSPRPVKKVWTVQHKNRPLFHPNRLNGTKATVQFKSDRRAKRSGRSSPSLTQTNIWHLLFRSFQDGENSRKLKKLFLRGMRICGMYTGAAGKKPWNDLASGSVPIGGITESWTSIVSNTAGRIQWLNFMVWNSWRKGIIR